MPGLHLGEWLVDQEFNKCSAGQSNLCFFELKKCLNLNILNIIVSDYYLKVTTWLFQKYQALNLLNSSI